MFGYADMNPTSLIDPFGLKAGVAAGGGVFGPSPAAHPVFQSGTPENNMIANDVKKNIALMSPFPMIKDAMNLMSSEKDGKKSCNISGASTPGMPNPEDPDDDDRIRARHAKDGHSEWNNYSEDELIQKMQNIRESGTPYRAGNGNILYPYNDTYF